MNNLGSILWIGFGSALGGMARCWMSGWVARYGPTFPWGTLTVNILGSFIIGLVAGLSAPEGRVWLSPATRDFIMIGVCGGFTTFSSFSLQTLNLLRDGDWLRAGANIVGSVLACMLAVWLGTVLAQVYNQWRSMS